VSTPREDGRISTPLEPGKRGAARPRAMRARSRAKGADAPAADCARRSTAPWTGAGGPSASCLARDRPRTTRRCCRCAPGSASPGSGPVVHDPGRRWGSRTRRPRIRQPGRRCATARCASSARNETTRSPAAQRAAAVADAHPPATLNATSSATASRAAAIGSNRSATWPPAPPNEPPPTTTNSPSPRSFSGFDELQDTPYTVRAR
jgi:hypothetical protein